MHPELEHLLANPPAFRPAPVFSVDGEFVSIFTRDAHCYAQRIDDTLTIYRDDETDELVGCKLKGVSTLLKYMDASGVCVRDKFSMSVLFMGWATTNKIAPENLEILYYLIDKFGNVTTQYSTLDKALPEHNSAITPLN